MENFQFSAKKSWYKQWWGAMIIVVTCLLLAFLIAGGLLVWRYYGLIKLGYGEELRKIIYKQNQQDAQILAVRTELETPERPFLGNREADLVIVAFIDFKCPICKEQESIMRQLVAKYGGKIKLIIRYFPIESLYPGATKIAEMSFCAHEQGLYWGAHDYLFSHQNELTQNFTLTEINAFINQIGVEEKSFKACLVADKTKIEVNKDYTTGHKYNISGTPTFFINGNKIQGNIPLENWEKIITTTLNP